AVEIDRRLGRLLPLRMERRDFASVRIDVFPDTKRGRTSIDVGPPVRAALPFGQRLNRGVPRLGPGEARFVQRDAAPVAHERVFRIVLISDRLPFAGEIVLREDRRAHGERADQQDCREERTPNHSAVLRARSPSCSWCLEVVSYLKLEESWLNNRRREP